MQDSYIFFDPEISNNKLKQILPFYIISTIIQSIAVVSIMLGSWLMIFAYIFAIILLICGSFWVIPAGIQAEACRDVHAKIFWIYVFTHAAVFFISIVFEMGWLEILLIGLAWLFNVGCYFVHIVLFFPLVGERYRCILNCFKALRLN